MKKYLQTVSISGVLAFVTGAMVTILLISLFASCAAPRWYGRAHDGCQQSQGFAGYGNGASFKK